MYGTIKDGVLISAPDSIVCDIEVNGGNKPFRMYNPTAKMYKDAGYLPVIEAEYPDDGKYYEKVYAERDGAIYGEWVEAEAPESEAPAPTLEQRVSDCEGDVAELNEALNMILEGAVE
ncbi:MAG: hypothetical protein IJ391_02745 [Clostridia bacterium]|nr:hypothetical protein [Clostridia bacterium]